MSVGHQATGPVNMTNAGLPINVIMAERLAELAACTVLMSLDEAGNQIRALRFLPAETSAQPDAPAKEQTADHAEPLLERRVAELERILAKHIFPARTPTAAEQAHGEQLERALDTRTPASYGPRWENWIAGVKRSIGEEKLVTAGAALTDLVEFALKSRPDSLLLGEVQTCMALFHARCIHEAVTEPVTPTAPTVNREALRGRLAVYTHATWSAWWQYVRERSYLNADGSISVPAWLAQRWAIAARLSYDDPGVGLSRRNQANQEAESILAVIESSLKPATPPAADPLGAIAPDWNTAPDNAIAWLVDDGYCSNWILAYYEDDAWTIDTRFAEKNVDVPPHMTPGMTLRIRPVKQEA